jgi:hypothetical protein
MGNKNGTLLKCPYDGGFVMPKICFSCGKPVSDKKWQVTSTNRLKNRKFIASFPVCDSCAEAKEQYIHIRPVNIVAAFVILLSIFSLLNPVSYFPKTLFSMGGVIWIVGVIAYVLWLNRKAKQQNSRDVLTRVQELQSAVTFEKITLPGKSKTGEVIVLFRNQQFAEEFKRLNKGREIQD